MDLFPFVTLFLGYGASYGTELLRDRRAAKREREAREATRQDREYERHVTFQEKTLLEMQQAALDLVQAGTELFIQWNKLSPDGSNWRGAQPRDELFNRSLMARSRSEMIVARINDAAVRRKVEGIQEHFDQTIGSTSAEECSKAMAFVFAFSEKLNERIGELLHELNRQETALVNTNKSLGGDDSGR